MRKFLAGELTRWADAAIWALYRHRKTREVI